MNDFLSNLITRSFTDAPVIQPRVVSLFETTVTEFLDEPGSSTPGIAAGETIAPTKVPAPVSELSLIGETATTESIVNVSDAPAEARLPKPNMPTKVPAPVSELSLIGETATTESIVNVSDAPAEAHSSKLGTPVKRNAPVIAQAPRLNVHTARVKKLELETNKVIVPVDSFRDRRKDADNKKALPKGFSEPRSVQPRRQRDCSPIEQPSSTSAPIIRVAIGRIEVRAIHPPAPTPKPATLARPKLSVEEYLHKQERGSR